MKKLSKYIYLYLFLLTSLILLNGCRIHNFNNKIIYPKNIEAMIEYETFDVERYKDQIDPLRKRISYEYTREDGIVVSVYWKEGFGAQINEYPPMPYFDKVFKKFNADGTLIKKGAYIGNFIAGKIGKWLECDGNGNCKVVDYEEGRGRFGYKQVLKFLEKKKQINLKTGWGRDRVIFSYSYENNWWVVDTVVPGTYIAIEYTLDGDTGKILYEKETLIEV